MSVVYVNEKLAEFRLWEAEREWQMAALAAQARDSRQPRYRGLLARGLLKVAAWLDPAPAPALVHEM
jgi:hypothetical protein